MPVCGLFNDILSSSVVMWYQGTNGKNNSHPVFFMQHIVYSKLRLINNICLSEHS
jgi:hypothetical protein